MTEWDWLRIIYLAMALGLLFATVRTHRIGGRKTLVLILVWLCIFMVAVGVAALFNERDVPPQLAPPSIEGDAVLT